MIRTTMPAAPSTAEIVALADRIERDVARLRALIKATDIDPAIELPRLEPQPDEEFISSSVASQRFGVSADTVQRRAARYGVRTVGTNNRNVRYSAHELRAAFAAK